MRNHKELIVWQKSMNLAELACKFVLKLPDSQKFIFSSQLQRAVISIPSNIAEGSKRFSLKEYIHFLAIAFASGSELETQLLLVGRIYPQHAEEVDKLIALTEEVLKMLNKLISSLKSKNEIAPTY